METEKLKLRFNELSATLLDWQNDRFFWEGELSSSALGVAVACAALHFYDQEANRIFIQGGMNWLKQHVNADGGFGDTPESPSNISTSLLCYASLTLNREYLPDTSVLSGLGNYLSEQGIDVHSEKVVRSILDFYGRDYTFSVPILVMCALCGVPGEKAFEYIPQLPFELVLIPRSFLSGLKVVSYAIPALVAVGIAIFKYKRGKNFLLKCIRKASIRKALIELEQMMPESGGFLEAIPLTAFVSMCLIESGFKDSPVVKKGIQFLQKTMRSDGGWAIDVNLSVWVSSLAVKSLRNNLPQILDEERRNALANYFLSVQNTKVHPFNGTSPGGWGWTDFSGSVPDGDDTPGVMLALIKLSKWDKRDYSVELKNACNWLLRLQNRDGGFPTFTKGWGKLPFDQSCTDLTGHVVLAVSKLITYLKERNPLVNISEYEKMLRRAIRFLGKHQRNDGALLPLWFGNQYVENHSNPVYGTARVVAYLQDALSCNWLHVRQLEEIKQIVEQGRVYLLSVQNEDGSWGAEKGIKGTIEETSLALSALIGASEQNRIRRAFAWLDNQYKESGLKASPIGLYFASLWYHEKMYPLVTYLEAITRELEFREL